METFGKSTRFDTHIIYDSIGVDYPLKMDNRLVVLVDRN